MNNVRLVAELWKRRRDGGTFDRAGNPVIPTGFAVGGVCNGMTCLLSKITEDGFTLFTNRWLETIGDAKYVGAWADGDVCYIDATEIVLDLDKALSIANSRGELAIWDFANAREIRVTEALAA